MFGHKLLLVRRGARCTGDTREERGDGRSECPDGQGDDERGGVTW